MNLRAMAQGLKRPGMEILSNDLAESEVATHHSKDEIIQQHAKRKLCHRFKSYLSIRAVRTGEVFFVDHFYFYVVTYSLAGIISHFEG